MSAGDAMLTASSLEGCPRCGIPIDALAFDESKVVAWPQGARETVLARFDLPAQYCGVLESFFQFTNEHAKDPSKIDTPSIRWRLLIDRHPAAPYPDLTRIVNPWGAYKPSVLIRLSPGARVELVAQRIGTNPDIGTVAGRLTGHYWYDTSYGAVRRGGHE